MSLTDPWLNTEPTSTLAEQLIRVAEDYDGDSALLALAIENARVVFTMLALNDLRRPYVYPNGEDGVLGEFPGQWNVSVHIDAEGTLWAHAVDIEEAGKHDFRTQGWWEKTFEGNINDIPGIVAWLEPLLKG